MIRLQQKRLSQLYRNDFYAFFKAAWPVVWPANPFIDNWHFYFLCGQIQQLAMRVIKKEPRIKDLCVNVPPATSKSSVISVCLNAWVWAHDPSLRFLTTSYSPELAANHAKLTKRLIESDWYQGLFGKGYRLRGSAETYFETDKGGMRMITSPNSAVGTGFHADFLIFDDPNAAQKVYSEAVRKQTIEWFSETMPSRLVNPDVSLKIVVQQRLHQMDVTGHIMKYHPEKWFFIVLPAVKSSKVHPKALAQYYKDNLLFPERLSAEVLKGYRRQLRNGFAGQYMMTPLNRGGNMFKERWFQWIGQERIPVMEQLIVSVDASFEEDAKACPVSIQVWGKARPNYYMLYDLTERLGAISTVNAIERVMRAYPGAMVVVERAANGYFVIEALKKKYTVFPFDPKKYGGKEIRAEMVLPLWETGNVYIFDSPHNREYYMQEILSFPSGEFKDRVDAMSQALLYFTRVGLEHGSGFNPEVRGF